MVELPEEAERQLGDLANESGFSASDYAREVIIDYLRDAETCRKAVEGLEWDGSMFSGSDIDCENKRVRRP